MLEQLTRKEQSIVWLLMQGLAPKKNSQRTTHVVHYHTFASFPYQKKVFCA